MKVWNSWRVYFMKYRNDKDAIEFELNMKHKYRQEKMAVNHFEGNLKKKHLHAWLVYTRCELEKKMILLEHESRAKKMALFLEAVSKDMVWNKKTEDVESVKKVDFVKNNSKTTDPTLQTLHELKVKSGVAKPRLSVEHNKFYQRKNLQEKLKSSSWHTLHTPRKEAGNDEATFDTHQETKTTNTNQDTVVQVEKEKSESQNLLQELSTLKEKGRLNSSRSSISSSRSSIIQSSKPTTKPLHLAMEEREKARKERKAQFDEQKRLRDELKLEELQEREAEKVRQEQHEKEELLKKKREEKKKLREEERQKQLRKEIFEEKLRKADEHYRRYLMKKYGMTPMKLLYNLKQTYCEKAEMHHRYTLSKKVLDCWVMFTNESLSRKRDIAIQCYDKVLLQRYFSSWKKIQFHMQNINRLAKWYHTRQIKKKVFYVWKDYSLDERILFWAQKSKAEEHSDNRVVKNSFLAWKKFVTEEKLERIREKRRNEMRLKVKTWLPDFNVASKSNDGNNNI